MTGPDSAPPTMSLDELLDLRELTERISSFLQKRLKVISPPCRRSWDPAVFSVNM